MAIPVAADVRAYLEGYGITQDVLSDVWITNAITREIIPHVKGITGLSFEGITTTTEVYSGTGQRTLLLDRRPVLELVDVEYNYIPDVNYDYENVIELDGPQGIIYFKYPYRVFPRGEKNIKVTYKYGFDDPPDDIKAAIEMLAGVKVLNMIGGRTGGGGISAQNYSKNYGSHGKYTEVMQQMATSAYAHLRPYMTAVVGA